MSLITSMRKCGFGPGSGRRGSRRASWGKDLLGRWLARRLALPAFFTAPPCPRRPWFFLPSTTAIFKCFTISKIWNLYLRVDIFEWCGCLADVGCAAFQAHPIRRCVYKATNPTFLAPSFHDYLGRTSHCHEPVQIEF